MVLFLHGGNGSGLEKLVAPGLTQISDDRGAAGISWKQNTATCQYTPAGVLGLQGGYINPSTGKACLAPSVSFTNSQPMIVVYPDGISDVGATDNTTRHWEDGRTPSPGQGGVTAEQRDDVGFIDFLIQSLESHETLLNPRRIYATGVSNGGMMTVRLACNAQTPAYVGLSQVAAFGAVVATMPAPLASGSDGREKCPATGNHPFAISFFVGNNHNALFTEHDCPQFPGTCGKTVNGDGFMPYGAAGGGPYYVNSPDSGQVISSPDNWSHWTTLLSDITGSTATKTSQNLGFFTTITDYSFGSSASHMTTYEANGGLHTLGGSRGDFPYSARLWDVVSAYRRTSSGALVHSSTSPMSGAF